MMIMIGIYYSAFGLVVGIQSNSVCGYKISHSLLKLNNEIYSKPSYTNTLYSQKLTCIDTMDYTIFDKEINLWDLQDSLEQFHRGRSFQKPIYNYNTKEIEDFETISQTENLLIYGPHVDTIHELCNYTLYVDVTHELQRRYLDQVVDCNFDPDFIIGVSSEFVTFLQKGNYINTNLENYPVESYNYKNYNGIKIDNFNSRLLPMFFKNQEVNGLCGLIKIVASLKLKEIIF